MEHLNLFKDYLEKHEHASTATVKNYVADVAKFVRWYENEFGVSFIPDAVSPQIIHLFRSYVKGSGTNEQASNIRSLKRYESSLRKFFQFARKENLVLENVMDSAKEQHLPPTDNGIGEFKHMLSMSGMANLTRKHYLLDIASFISWTKEVITQTQGSNTENILPYISEVLVNEYKDRLLYDRKLSPASINRKLSSIRRYINWAREKGKLPQYADLPKIQNITKHASDKPSSYPERVLEIRSHEPVESPAMSADSAESPLTPLSELTDSPFVFGPLRLARSLKGITGRMVDLSLIPLVMKAYEAKEYLTWLAHGKKMFDSQAITHFSAPRLSEGKPTQPPVILPPVGNISKRLYAPVAIDQKPFHKQVIHILRYQRPVWYKRYHSYPITHYIHFAILMLSISIMGYFFMDHVGLTHAHNLAFSRVNNGSPRILSFQGLLKDAGGNPITTPTSVRFAIYSNQNASESARIWDEMQTITPNADGTFTTNIGGVTTIPDTLFATHPALYLGVKVGDQAELEPREQIATASLSQNAETLQGLHPITETGVAEKNAILALDSAGNLTFSGSADHTFQAIGGQFSLSGQAVLLTTTPGSNGNVVINPDNLGTIDLQKPLQNTSNDINNLGITGAVTVNDMVAINATQSGQSALYINQNDSGDIISAHSGGSAKFTLQSDGTAFFSGNVGIGTAVPNATLDVSGTIHADKIGLGTLPDASYALIAQGNIRASSIVGDQLKTTVTEETNLVKLLIGAPSGQSADLAQFQINGTSVATLTNTGNLGIGFDHPTTRLGVNGDTLISGNLLLTGGPRTISNIGNERLIIGDLATGDVLLQPNGLVGIGTNTPKAKVQISGGGLCVGADGNCKDTDNTEGVIYASSTTTSVYDVAEDYPTHDTSLTPGDIVVLDENTGVFVKKSSGQGRETAIGVISEKPGVHLGGFNGTQFKNEKQVAVGLSGRIPVRVTSQNGPIHIGDPLTASSIPGVAMKATEPGPIIGISLGTYTAPDNSSIGSVMFFISNRWYDSHVSIAASGDLQGISFVADSSSGEQTDFRLLDKLGGLVSLVAKNLTADSIIVRDLSVTSLTIGGQTIDQVVTKTLASLPTLNANKIIAPIAAVDSLQTNLISPLASTSAIALRLNPDNIAIYNSTTATKPVASIDNSGNASFSGTLTSQSLQTTDASIDGTLRVKKIIADQIEGLPQASPAATYITNTTNIYQNTASQSAGEATPDPSSLLASHLTNDVMNIASYSGIFGYVPSLTSDFEQVNKGFVAFGPTSLAETSVTGQLSVNGNLIISQNSVNVLGADLALQPLKQGNVSFMAGLVLIDTDGNLTVSGNALFARDLTVKGRLNTSLIQPIPNHDLTIQNASQSAVITINNNGDLQASGSGSFEGLIAKTFHIVRTAQADTSDTETIASASAGTATILPGQFERTIISPFVKADSLIYLTPVSDTGSNSPYLARQTAEDQAAQTKGSFTVALPNVATKEIKLNWWIVN